MSILITGGLGYIGSHLCVDLLEFNFNVITVDISNDINIIDNIEKISNKKILKHYSIDISNKEELEKVFQENKILAVIHLAGYKSMPESIIEPLKYFQNNLTGSITLFEVMSKYKCNNIIFSSSASVYSKDNPLPITEDSTLKANNPYSFTKLSIEEMLHHIYTQKFHQPYQERHMWNIIILRYFNPIGIHTSGLLPFRSDTSLMSSIIKTLKGDQEYLDIYGRNYETKDGTAMRDFIHISDLVSSHTFALNKILSEKSIFKVYNVGTGNGTTILDLIDTIQNITEKKLNYRFVDERPGDIPKIYTSIDKIKKELEWKPQFTIKEACQSILNR